MSNAITKGKQDLLQVKMRPVLYTKLKALADKQGISVAELVRGLILKELQRQHVTLPREPRAATEEEVL